MSVVGCVANYTWKKPQGQVKSGGGNACYDQNNPCDLSPEQIQVRTRISDALDDTGLTNVVVLDGGHGLLAGSLDQYHGVSSSLFADQWIRELNRFFGIGLVTVQMLLSQFPRGNSSGDAAQDITPPPPVARWMCTNQVIQRNDYTSFHMIGVIVILVVGGSFIVLDCVLSNLMHSKRVYSSKASLFRVLDPDRQWKYTSPYYLQAVAYEALGIGGKWNDERLVPTSEDERHLDLVWKALHERRPTSGFVDDKERKGWAVPDPPNSIEQYEDVEMQDHRYCGRCKERARIEANELKKLG